MGLTTILWVLVALLTKPDPEVLLSGFYRRARPLGWWKPFQHLNESLEKQNGEVLPIFRGICIATIGAVAVALLILGLSQLWFGQFGTGTLSLGASAILFFAFRKTVKAYLEFLAVRAADSEDKTVSKSHDNFISNEK